MKNITNNYKNEIKKFGRQINIKISYENNSQEIELGSSQLNSVSLHYEGNILKSVMKQLDLDSNVNIPIGTNLTCQFGVLVNNQYEYINLGNFIVKDSEKQEDLYSYKITCYDSLLLSMKDYNRLEITYPITIRNYLQAICDYLGITFANSTDTFANYNKQIQNELYLDESGGSLGYTFRDVLDELAQVTASTICINDDDELEIRYINNTQDTINEKYLKNINVNFGEKYGPVNTIVLSRAGGSDKIYKSYPDNLLDEDKIAIEISENQIMNFNDRDTYLPDILNQLRGLEYYINDFSSTGITYYELCDMYNISIDNNTYKCLMLNDEINITHGLEELIHTDMPEGSDTDYDKADKTDRKINQTYIIANKQQGQIEALISRTDTLEDKANNTYTKEQVEQLILDAENGLTNTFTQSGGNNILRNTGLWFVNSDYQTSQQNPYEFWQGVVVKTSEDKATNFNAMLLQNATLIQEQLVPNGIYTISFKYKKLIELAVIKCVINDIEYNLTEMDDTDFKQTIEVSSQHINIKFVNDVNNSFIIYDLMANKGDIDLPYTQNQNETTTDTVNISKGITITSTTEETTFRANADGVRIYANNDLINPKTKFTDKGTETDYLKAKEEAEIVDLLIQRVGNHTWITKI